MVDDSAKRSGSAWLITAAVAAMLVFAPLVRGANRPLPLLVLELAALLLLAALWLRRDGPGESLPAGLAPALWLTALLPLIFLIPLPADWWLALPGRDAYGPALALGGEGGWRAGSLVPYGTESAWLALLPPLAVFLAVATLPAGQVKSLVHVALAVAVFEALLGLVQFGEGPGGMFSLGNPQAHGGFGTYANRNHLAGLLEMALPVALALLCAKVGHSQMPAGYYRSWRHRVGDLSSLRVNAAAFFAAIALVLLLGLVFTRSRSGVALAMVAILLATVAFARRLGGNNIFGLVGTLTAATIALAAEIGLAPVLQRFTGLDPLADARWPIFAHTLQAVGTFFPLGSGPGTFADVFPRFQPLGINSLVNHAHNDYLEWLTEGGIAAGVAMVIWLGLFLRQWPRLWVRGDWTTFRFVQVGAGIGVLLMLLHSLMDFNLHIPANALYFAFFAAVFFHRPASGRRGLSAAAAQRRSPAQVQGAPDTEAVMAKARHVRNPFLD